MSYLQKCLLLLFLFAHTISEATSALHKSSLPYNTILKRLEPAIKLLDTIPKQLIYKTPLEDITTPSDYAIAHCITKIKKEKKLSALFSCWQCIISYEKQLPHACLKCFVYLIGQTLSLIKTTTLKELKKNSLIKPHEICQSLNNLPLTQVLNTIDMLTIELPIFLEKYEFNSSMNWKTWLKKYWWVPPIIFFWFGLKVLIQFQDKQYYHRPPLSASSIIAEITDPELIELIRRRQRLEINN